MGDSGCVMPRCPRDASMCNVDAEGSVHAHNSVFGHNCEQS